jgi:hypothetical protein
MKQALFVVSGVAIGFLSALVAPASNKSMLPPAEAQAGPGPGNGASGPTFIVATGGSTPNVNDLCWIIRLEKGKTAKGQEYDRSSLSLYKAANNGSSFDLVDTRETTWDNKPVNLNVGTHNKNLTPQDLKKAWEDELRREKDREEKDAKKQPTDK